MNEKQNITIYVNKKGIIEEPTEIIISKNATITIDIKPEVKKIIEKQNKKITFCDYFLRSTDIYSLIFIDNVGIQMIGNNFLEFCGCLKKIELSGLSNVTQIGDNFLSNCKGLTNINLSGLSNVIQIGNNFLSNCTGLTNINLSQLSNLRYIGFYIFSDCSSLESIKILPHQRSIIFK
jgi:hypothetical protein